MTFDNFEDKDHKKIVFNNFEQFIYNEELPNFGKDETKVIRLEEFYSPFWTF